MAQQAKSGAVVMVVVVVAALLPPLVSSQGSRRVIFPPDECKDGNVQCPRLANKDSCDTDRYMKEICQLSCKTCPGSGLSATTTTTAAPTTSPESTPAAPTTTFRAPPAFDVSTTSQPSAPRRSIVNPNFRCGGAPSPGHSRRTRQATSRPGLHHEDPQFTAVTSSPAGVSGPPITSSCGASVISERFLLTAASCIDPSNPISSVRLGDLDLATEGENNSAPVDYDIVNIILFPQDQSLPPNRYNDIALLRTHRDIVFNDVVFPYCISAKKPTPGTTVIAAGFGHYNETHKSTHVLEGKLKVIPMAECEEQYLLRNEQRLRKAFPALLQKPRGLLCAGDVKTGVCEGDEGGPLYREDEQGRRFLEGITSFTDERCGDGLLPGLFTAVADYVPFIDSVLYGDQLP